MGLIARELNESLSKGESFEETLHTPYVEHALQQFFQIAIHGSNCEKNVGRLSCDEPTTTYQTSTYLYA